MKTFKIIRTTDNGRRTMNFIICLLSFIFIQALPAEAVKTVNANPINVAVVLVEKGDSANIEGLFKYYGYSLQGIDDGYQVMRHDTGDEIRYSFYYDGKINTFPTIIIRPKGSQKDKHNCLINLNFEKVGNFYEHMKNRYNHLVTRCNFGPNNTLIFKRTKQ